MSERGDATASEAVDATGADAATDGGERSAAHTVRLELVDEPGQLLTALEPIADHGGNLLSIYHERGHVTPRGRIPVEVDLECPPERFETIVTALREAGVTVVEAGAERYSDEVTLLLVGDLVGADLSGTVRQIEEATGARVEDVSLAAPEGTSGEASARLRLAVHEGRAAAVVDSVRAVASERNLHLVPPLTGGTR